MTKRSFFLGSFLLNLLLGSCGGRSGADSAADPPPGSSDWPLFVYPRPGEPNADITRSITWTAAKNARAYELQIGTTLGGNDVFDSGIITSTSIAMPTLPASVVIYARVRAILNGWGDASPAGHWSRGSYTSFRTDDYTPPSTFTNVGTTQPLPAGAPVKWNANPLALGYRLVIDGAVLGTAPAGSNNPINGSQSPTDTGVIHTTRVFITAAPNSQVSATLYTIFKDRIVTTQLQFTTTGGAPTFAEQYALGETLTAEIRTMADRDNQPYGPTILDTVTNQGGLSVASCAQFMYSLIKLIHDTHVGLSARGLDIALQNNGYDTHTLVEVLDTTTNRWITLDPTFGLVTLGADGTPATSSEISAAARAQNWSALQYDFLTPVGSGYANDYYIDYPLLYLNVELADDSSWVQPPPATLAPYFEPAPLPVTDASTSTYSLQCASGDSSATAQINGGAQTFPCSGSDSLTPGFLADDIKAVDASTSVAWKLLRFTF
jgi:hypothetical protein